MCIRDRVYVAEEDQYVLVKNGIPGQKIRFGINKFKHGRAEGRLLEVLERSPLETREPVCSLFPACGGCMYQTMSYEAQLEMKAEQMKEIIEGADVYKRQECAPGNIFSYPAGEADYSWHNY